MTQAEFFAYCRESINLESGIEIQKELINKYCSLTDKKIIKWFIDNDSSAYEFRPKYDQMMSQILSVQAQVAGIICANLSRFGRSTTETLMAYNNLKNAGKQLILVKENIDGTTPAGKAMLGMLAVFNDFEHDVILERTKAGIEHAKKYGTKSGKPMHRPIKEINWKKFDEYKKMGVSINSIAKILQISRKTLYRRIDERAAAKNS